MTAHPKPGDVVRVVQPGGPVRFLEIANPELIRPERPTVADAGHGWTTLIGQQVGPGVIRNPMLTTLTARWVGDEWRMADHVPLAEPGPLLRMANQELLDERLGVGWDARR